jgi:transcription elongation factor GreA
LLEEEMSKVPLTVTGAEKLREELHRLKTVDRPSVVAAIAEARSHGDLSENAEYDAAKERQGFIEGRIQEVEGKLSNAQIIDPKLLDADGRCVFGATVEMEDQDSGDGVTYQIVGEDEADIKNGKISVNSPVARALIGKYAGDIAQVQARVGFASTKSSTSATSNSRAQVVRRSLPVFDHLMDRRDVGCRIYCGTGTVCQPG